MNPSQRRTLQQVSPHVYIDPDFAGCTVGAIQTEEGVVLIDSPHKPTRARRWLESVRKLGEVRYLVNTEHHVDHTFGNAFLPGIVVAQQQTKDRFWEDNVLGGNPLKDPGPYIEMSDPAAADEANRYQAREPELSFTDRLRLSLGSVEIDLFPMPGHIEAETAVFVRPDRVLFTSDNVFHEAMIWYQEALPFEWLETLEAFERMDVEVVVPGHGTAAGPDLLEEMRARVDKAVDKVQSAIEHGASRQTAVETLSLLDDQPVPQDYRSFAPMLQRVFVGRIYDQIMAQFP